MSSNSTINPFVDGGYYVTPAGITIAGIVKEYKTYADMLADEDPGLYGIVEDATGDPTVKSGSATYKYKNGYWKKVYESELMDLELALRWENIRNKPESSVEDIDAAVNIKHEHNNLAILQKITATDDRLSYNNAAYATLAELTVTNQNLTNVTSTVTTINSKIPEEATISNKLADKAWVTSQITTSAAVFQGNYANWAAVPTTVESFTTAPKKNDYLIVLADEHEERLNECWRYVYTGTGDYNKDNWKPEYRIENKPFTEVQMAAINSTATVDKINQIATNKADIEQINITLLTKADQTSLDTVSENLNLLAGSVTTLEAKVDTKADNETVITLRNDLTTTQGNVTSVTSRVGVAEQNISDLQANLTSHVTDSTIHITADERTKWNGYDATISTISTELTKKVDKVEGKGLSTNDYDNNAVAEVAKVANKVDKIEGKGLSANDYTDAAVAEVAKIANKVDKEEGKGLSTNDYDDVEKAEVAKIANKVDKVEGKGLSTHDYDDAAVAKVAEIDGKAALVHTHSMNDVDGLNAKFIEIEGKIVLSKDIIQIPESISGITYETTQKYFEAINTYVLSLGETVPANVMLVGEIKTNDLPDDRVNMEIIIYILSGLQVCYYANAYSNSKDKIYFTKTTRQTIEQSMTWTIFSGEEVLQAHTNNTDIHVTTDDKANWNAKATSTDITTAISEHSTDTTVHANKQDKLVADSGITITDANISVDINADILGGTVSTSGGTTSLRDMFNIYNPKYIDMEGNVRDDGIINLGTSNTFTSSDVMIIGNNNNLDSNIGKAIGNNNRFNYPGISIGNNNGIGNSNSICIGNNITSCGANGITFGSYNSTSYGNSGCIIAIGGGEGSASKCTPFYVTSNGIVHADSYKYNKPENQADFVISKSGVTEISLRDTHDQATTHIANTDIHITAAERTTWNNKVDKTTTIAGIDLQDNIEKDELLTAINVADGAQVNVIENININGDDLVIDTTTKKASGTVKPFATFPDTWTNHDITMAMFCSQIFTSEQEGVVKTGSYLLGELANMDPMPIGIGNAEVTIYIPESGIYIFNMTSTTTSPYHWEANGSAGYFSGWRQVLEIAEPTDTGTYTATLSAENPSYSPTSDTERDFNKTYYINENDVYRKAINSDFNEDGSFITGKTYYVMTIYTANVTWKVDTKLETSTFDNWRKGSAITLGGGTAEATNYGIAIGYNATSELGLAIGADTKAEQNALALGRYAEAIGNGAVQINAGTNTDADTLKFGNAEKTWNCTIVNSNGKIPTESLEFNPDNKVDKTFTIAGIDLGTDITADALRTAINVENGAQVNTINSVETAELTVDENKKLSINAVAIAKISGLSDALDNKVDKTTTIAGIDLQDNIVKNELLTAINVADGAQVNVIDSVETTELTIDADKKLSINAIATSKVTGLDTALSNKVDKDGDKVLSTNDYTTEEKTKLSGIETGAQVNVVKSVTSTGSGNVITNTELSSAGVLTITKGTISSGPSEATEAEVESGTVSTSMVTPNMTAKSVKFGLMHNADQTAGGTSLASTDQKSIQTWLGTNQLTFTFNDNSTRTFNFVCNEVL